jgi:hypothetical protein
MKVSLSFLFFLAVAALVCSCGLFEPRVPDEPGAGGVPWIPPTEPESVFVNIKNALEGKVTGNYVQCFTDDFVFHPDPSDSVELTAVQPGIYDDWTLGVEQTVMQTVLDEAASIRITFTEREPEICASPDECFFYYKYELQIIAKVGGTEYFYGFLDYHMRREGGEWYVYMWLDKRDPAYQGFRSWGNLKGTKR